MTTLAELGEDWRQYDVLGVDEGQFFSDVSLLLKALLPFSTGKPFIFDFFCVKVVEFCEMAALAGKIVIVSALSGTYLREGFNSILDLVPKAEKIKQLHAICKLCHYQASFTLRTTAESSLELIGGNEAYMPVCRECFALKNQE